MVCTTQGATSYCLEPSMVRYAITDRPASPEMSRPDEAELLRSHRLGRQWHQTSSNSGRRTSTRRRPGRSGPQHAGSPPHPHSRAPKLLINSRADVAVAAGADGVHLTSAPGSLTPAQVRQLYAAAGLPEPVVSVSCHTLAEVAARPRSGADPDPLRPGLRESGLRERCRH